MKISDYLQSQGIVPSAYSPDNPLRVLFDTSAVFRVLPSCLELKTEGYVLAYVKPVKKEVEKIAHCKERGSFVHNPDGLIKAMEKMKQVIRYHPSEEDLKMINETAERVLGFRRRDDRYGPLGYTDVMQIAHALTRARKKKPTLMITQDKKLSRVLKEASQKRGYCGMIEVKPFH